MPHFAVYLRVSTRRQDTRSQEPDLKRWLEAYAHGGEVRWYRDAASGKSMDRPGWKNSNANWTPATSRNFSSGAWIGLAEQPPD